MVRRLAEWLSGGSPTPRSRPLSRRDAFLIRSNACVPQWALIPMRADATEPMRAAWRKRPQANIAGSIALSFSQAVQHPAWPCHRETPEIRMRELNIEDPEYFKSYCECGWTYDPIPGIEYDECPTCRMLRIPQGDIMSSNGLWDALYREDSEGNDGAANFVLPESWREWVASDDNSWEYFLQHSNRRLREIVEGAIIERLTTNQSLIARYLEHESTYVRLWVIQALSRL